MRQITDLKPNECIAIRSEKEARKISKLTGSELPITKNDYVYLQTGVWYATQQIMFNYEVLEASEFLPKNLKQRITNLEVLVSKMQNKPLVNSERDAFETKMADEILKNRKIEVYTPDLDLKPIIDADKHLRTVNNSSQGEEFKSGWRKNKFGALAFFDNDKVPLYGIVNLEWCSKIIGSYVEYPYPALNEEVSDALIAYAKRLYPAGTKFKPISGIISSFTIYDETNFKFLPAFNEIVIDGAIYHTLFSNGQWAEVLSKPKAEPEIDWSKPCLVEYRSREDSYIVLIDSLYESIHSNPNYFAGIVVRSLSRNINERFSEYSKFKKSDFKLYTGEITLKNPT